MRILLSAVPAAGHLFPLLPLADAAAAAGHEVAFLSGPDAAGHLAGRTLLPAGPGIAALLAEAERRAAAPEDPEHPVERATELFAGARIDLTYDDALDQVRKFDPEIMICESTDFVGPLVAAALDVPWASYTITAPMPPQFFGPLNERAAAQHTARGLSPRERFALIDPRPEVLRAPEDPPHPADRVTIRPTVHLGDEAGEQEPALPTERPLVLVTVGTSTRDPEVLPGLVASVTDAGFRVVATSEPGTLPEHPLVHEVGFVPLARLLPAVDAIVGVGGSGTVLATLAAGLPMVLRPVMADQPWNARRVAAAGVGLTIEQLAEAGEAVRTVLTDPAFQTTARAAAESIRSMPSPDVVLNDLLARAAVLEQA